MQRETLYRKKGRRYYPVNDPYALDGLEEGFWLIQVTPQFTSIRSLVEPSRAPLEAAIKEKEEQVLEIVRNASQLHYTVELNEDIKKDFQRFIDKHGKVLYYPSASEISNRIVRELIKDNNEIQND